jgi:hypothetical protein
VRAIDSRNHNQKVPIQGLRVGAVTMARDKRGCLDHPFSQTTSPAIEPLFSAAIRFCLYRGGSLVAKTTWLAIGLDGKPHHVVEIPVP